MNKYRKLVGEKCYLAPLDTSEADIVAKWSNDMEMSIKTGDISDIITYNHQKDYLEGMNGPSGYAFYIVEKSTDKVIGIARLMRINFIYRNAVMGMFIGEKSNRNHGIGTEAGNLLLDFAFNVLNLINVMVEVFSFNEASLKLCKKCGFKEIGRRRNAIIYGKHQYDEVFLDILNEEFQNSRIEKALVKE